MKGATPLRPKKPPSMQKLKLLCSFGGDFLPREPTGEFRYTGGETRILSIDRSEISLSKLLETVSDLCPNRPFSLKYQLLEASGRKDGLGLLVPIASDDDVRRIIEDHDSFVSRGKVPRLRVFICAGYVGTTNLESSIGFYSQLGDFSDEKDVFSREVALVNRNVMTHVSEFRNSCASIGKDVFGTQNVPEIRKLPVSRFKVGLIGGVGINQSVPSIGSSTIEPYVRRVEHVNTNRENIIPWNVKASTVDACLAPIFFRNQSNRKIFGGSSELSGNPHCRTRNQWFSEIDTQHHCVCPCDVWGYRSGLHDLGVRRTGDVHSCMVKCDPGVRTRSNISKRSRQTRSHQTHLAKRVEVGSNDEILREQALQQSKGKSLPNHLNGRGSGLSMGFENQKLQGNWVNSLDSCLPPDGNEKPVLHFGDVRKDLFCNSRAKRVARSHTRCNSNPFSNALRYPEGNDKSSNCTISNQQNSHGIVDEEVCFVKPVKRDDVDAVSSIMYSSSNAPGKDIQRIYGESKKNPTCPQSDLIAQLDQICEAVGASNNGSFCVDLCGIKSPMDLSLHHPSLSSSTEVHPPTLCSPFSSGDVLELDVDVSAAIGITHPPRLETRPQLNKGDLMEECSFSSEPLSANMVEETGPECSNGKTDICIQDGTELSSVRKLSRLSCLLVERVSLGEGKDPAYFGKNQETMASSLNREEKARVAGSTSIRSKEVSETNRSLPTIYSHLVTQELQTIKDSDLEEIRELGSGTYGTVFYGKWKGSDVAIKRLKPSCFAGDELGEDRLVADFWKEAHLLGQLHHPNVVAFYGVVTDGPVTNLATVTEYMVNGSLKQVLQRKDRTIDRRKRLIIAMDAAFGMEYLHEKNVVHFDLKSHNLLVNMRDPHRPVCKIGDLGLSKVKQRTLVSGGVRGTIPWMAPELLTSKSNMVTEKVDIYSFGIVMWELLTGEEPYENMRSEEILAGIIKGYLRPEIPSWCDPAWRSLMERCWSSDASSRPAFSEIAKELRAVAVSSNIK